MVGLIIGGIIFGSVTLAPDYTPIDSYVAYWEQQEITVDTIEEYLRVIDTMYGKQWLPEIAFQVQAPPTLPAQVTSFPQGVEQWRWLVEIHFQPADVPWALRVMNCESHGNPYAKNPISTASGLFQFLRGWWSGAWGYPAFDPFDPEANVKAAAWLYYTDGPKHWVCK